MRQELSLLKYELNEELTNILRYWCDNTVDQEFGGFLGRITHHNKVVEKANKGIILNTRILWSFSAAGNHLNTQTYLKTADRAYQYLRDFFVDRNHGGVFWELNYEGKPINKRKQIYAQAFAIYAFSEYYLYSGQKEAKQLAIELFELIETYSRDYEKEGYLEAFDQDWGVMEDLRLSRKDMNASKTMNTHLHILEAYTTLLKIHKDPTLQKALEKLTRLILDRFLDTDHYHYHLFFDEDWQLLSNTVSYGHDIETAWLVIEAAKTLKNQALIQESEQIAIKVIDTFLAEALDKDGAVINEKNLTTLEVDTDRHWWPQVEAMIGLTIAFQKTSDKTYLNKCMDIWAFVKQYLIDRKHGEWYFRVDQNGKVYTEEDKVSMWKAPYHTSRACIMLNSI